MSKYLDEIHENCNFCKLYLDMQQNSSTHSAFITPRILVAFVLLLGGALLAAFALHSNSHKFASAPAGKRAGAGVPLFKDRGEPLPADLQVQSPVNYTGPH